MNELEKTNPRESRNINALGGVNVEAIYKGAQEEQEKQAEEFTEWLGEIRKPDEKMGSLMDKLAEQTKKDKQAQAEREIKDRMAQAEKEIYQEVTDKYKLEDETKDALKNTLKGLFNDR